MIFKKEAEFKKKKTCSKFVSFLPVVKHLDQAIRTRPTGFIWLGFGSCRLKGSIK